MRVISVIVKNFHSILIIPCEIFLGMYTKLLDPATESKSLAVWQVVLILETFKNMFSDTIFSQSVFQGYDLNEHTGNVYSEIVQCTAKIIFSRRDLLGPCSMANISVSEQSGSSGVEFVIFGNTNSSIRVPFYEQLDKTDAPLAPSTYPLFLAVKCILNVIEHQSSFALPLLQPANNIESVEAAAISSEKGKANIMLAIEMAKMAAPSILSALVLLSTSIVDDELLEVLLHSFKSFTIVCGLLGLVHERDSFITAMCRLSIPGCLYPSCDPSQIPPVQYSAVFANRITNPQPPLSERNIQFVTMMVCTIEALGSVVDAKILFIVFETLQITDGLISSGKIVSKRVESSPALDTPSMVPGFQRTRTLTTLGTLSPVPVPVNASSAQLDRFFILYTLTCRQFIEKSVLLPHRSLIEHLRALCRLSYENIQVSNNVETKDEKYLSFGISRIRTIALCNVSRMITNGIEGESACGVDAWELVITQLIQMAHSNLLAHSMRMQVMQCFDELLVSSVTIADLGDVTVERRILEPIKTMMGIESSPTIPALSDESGKSATWLPDVQKCSLETLNRVLQANGQDFRTGWALTLDIVHSVVSAPTMKLKIRKKENVQNPSESTPNSGTPVTSGYIDPGMFSASEPLISAKTVMVARVAFPCIQLICSDFLSMLPPEIIFRCIDILSLYASLQDDLNISLTAIGLLWSLCDFILTKRSRLQKELMQNEITPENVFVIDDSEQQTPLNLEALKMGSASSICGNTMDSRTMDRLWMHLLRNLSDICCDDRSEVRNSANQTLFRTIGLNGKLLNLKAWNFCILQVLFPLLDTIKSASSQAERAGPTAKIMSPKILPIGAKTVSQQWDETKIITITAVTSAILEFLLVLLELPTFSEIWANFLGYLQTSCVKSSNDVMIASLKNLRLVFQHNSFIEKLPVKYQPTIPLMWAVVWDNWELIGLNIAAGTNLLALSENESPQEPLGLSWSDGSHPKLADGSTSQDTITLFIGIFADFFPLIRSQFGSGHLTRLFKVFRSILLYQSIPEPGNGRTRYDLVNDLDSPSPVQAHILDFLTGKLDLSSIKGSPEAILDLLSDLIVLPFVSPRLTPLSLDDTPQLKLMTYMSLSKRSLQLLVSEFEKHGKRKSVYSGGHFTIVLESLRVPMESKYNCPASGSKDSTPLWRSAANGAMTIIKIGLETLEKISRGNQFSDVDLESSQLDSIYGKLLDLLGDFLLTKRYRAFNEVRL